MRILGIETSCDETACGIVEDGRKLLSNVVLSSMDLHKAYGGVVPEIAARSHIEAIVPVINQALTEAKYGQGFGLDGVQGSNEQRTSRTNSTVTEPSRKLTQQSAKSASGVTSSASQQAGAANDLWEDIDGIAVTYGAGLGGSLLVGVMTARTLAITKEKPLYAVNHVEGHIYANFLTDTSLSGYKLPSRQPEFPMLGLIVSGGHSQLVLWRNYFDYTLLGQTHDDAIGEAFDKVAKILGLPYPGGPSIGEAAKRGNPFAYNFPKAQSNPVKVAHVSAMQGKDEQRTEPYIKYGEGAAQSLTPQSATSNRGVSSSAGRQSVAMRGLGKYDFSFSGIKTAVLRAAQAEIGENHTFPSSGLSERLSDAQKADFAASFQRIAVETVVDKTALAYEEFKPRSVVIGGGVAASPELRRQLAERLPLLIEYTDMKLCTDNGAMIATLGCFQAMNNRVKADPYTLEIAPNLSM